MEKNSLTERFQKLDTFLVRLIQQLKDKKKIEKEKEKIAKEIIGLPYYWGEYAGIIEPSSKPTHVVAHLVNQKTGEEVYWTLDTYRVFDYLQEIKIFSTWEAYHQDQLLKSATDLEQMIKNFGYSKTKSKEIMRKYCKKFSIPYKD